MQILENGHHANEDIRTTTVLIFNNYQFEFYKMGWTLILLFMQESQHTPEKSYETPDNKPKRPPVDRHVWVLRNCGLFHLF